LNAAATGKSTSGTERQKVLKGVKRTAAHARKNNNPVTSASDAEQSTVPVAYKSPEKNYSPHLFAGAHVSELLTENAALKNKVWLIRGARWPNFWFAMCWHKLVYIEQRPFPQKSVVAPITPQWDNQPAAAPGLLGRWPLGRRLCMNVSIA